MMSKISHNRLQRLARWCKLPKLVFQAISNYDRAYIIAAIQEYGKYSLAKSQIAKYDAVRNKRLSRNQQQIAQFIVILAGSLTFSVAPQLLAKQAGRGYFSISAGLVGGGLASYYAHKNATNVLIGAKLKKATENTQRAIMERKI
jgi:hypothetical protein